MTNIESISRVWGNEQYILTPPFLYQLPTADNFKGGIVSGDPPQAEFEAAHCHSPFFRTGGVLLYVHKINKPTEKGN